MIYNNYKLFWIESILKPLQDRLYSEQKWLKIGKLGKNMAQNCPFLYVCFGPGPVHLQTRVRVRELDPGTRVSDPGLDALVSI